MNSIPTLTDFLHHHWEKREWGWIWYWGKHKVMFIWEGPDKQWDHGTAEIGWRCPRCGKRIFLRYYDQEGAFGDGSLEDFHLPIPIHFELPLPKGGGFSVHRPQRLYSIVLHDLPERNFPSFQR